MIRLATPDDAPAIAAIHVRSWQAAYRGCFPDDFLNNLDVEQRAKRWAEIIGRQPQDVAVFELPSGIAGFVSVGPSRDHDAAAGVGEVTAIYLDPSHWRKGMGTALIDWAKDSARSREWQRVTLWVLRENRPARSFYEAMGFRADGRSKEETFGGALMMEVRYAWACDPVQWICQIVRP